VERRKKRMSNANDKNLMNKKQKTEGEKKVIYKIIIIII